MQSDVLLKTLSLLSKQKSDQYVVISPPPGRIVYVCMRTRSCNDYLAGSKHAQNVIASYPGLPYLMCVQAFSDVCGHMLFDIIITTALSEPVTGQH